MVQLSQAAPSHPARDRAAAPAQQTHSASIDDALDARDGHSPAPAGSSSSPDLPWYRRESWLMVALFAFIPICLALVAPAAWRIPLSGLGGILMVVAFIMMVRRDRAVHAEERRDHPDHLPG